MLGQVTATDPLRHSYHVRFLVLTLLVILPLTLGYKRAPPTIIFAERSAGSLIVRLNTEQTSDLRVAVYSADIGADMWQLINSNLDLVTAVRSGLVRLHGQSFDDLDPEEGIRLAVRLKGVEAGKRRGYWLVASAGDSTLQVADITPTILLDGVYPYAGEYSDCRYLSYGHRYDGWASPSKLKLALLLCSALACILGRRRFRRLLSDSKHKGPAYLDPVR